MPMFRYRSKTLFFTFVCIALCFAASTAAAQPSLGTLEERMSQKDFDASGLNRLSPAELAHLNAWLGARPVVMGSSGKVRSEPQFYPEDNARQPITARINGTFQGWRGKTRVTLDNGQVWQQDQSGSVGDVQMTDPEVRIKPMMLGSWLMNVDGCSCSVRVKRVE